MGNFSIKVVDDVIGVISCPSTVLAVGANMTCTVTGKAIDVSTIEKPVLGTCGKITETPLYKNKGEVTAETVEGEAVKDEDPSHYCNPLVPGIDIEKLTNDVQADGPNDGTAPQIAIDGKVTWTYLVENTGNLRLDPVVVIDDQIGKIDCPKDALDPGDKMTCTAMGKAIDVSTIVKPVLGTCGNITETPLYANKGTATGTPIVGDPVEDVDPSHYCNPYNPAIDIEKSTNGVDADNPAAGDAPQVAIGGSVDWSYIVTNTGDVKLVDVTVVDDQGVTVNCPQNTLEIGAMMTCTANGTAVDLLTDILFTKVKGICVDIPGVLYQNEGTATGTTVAGDEVDDTDPSHYCNPPVVVGGEGCTPGYWKQKQHFDSWTNPPYDPDNMFVSAGFDDAFPGMTLLEVLKQGGGGLKALGRHTVAALLNTASDGVAYDLT